ncbi:uncharacterized protein B0H18DRAFT_1036175 [Fomitopsis serialis]|uniref:uncharacterized protein n=1 Tax=Fomitopsis serialis TaxID=139415 RepID=UPI002007E1CE|nr:uncharacterized protein B0H18DRAFT_1036175 [Neoantrodia serialis]KAH9917009.1 hypothetical protein B0H18DRAFT_1036175 [Neoantrodia serialis]
MRVREPPVPPGLAKKRRLFRERERGRDAGADGGGRSSGLPGVLGSAVSQAVDGPRPLSVLPPSPLAARSPTLVMDVSRKLSLDRSESDDTVVGSASERDEGDVKFAPLESMELTLVVEREVEVEPILDDSSGEGGVRASGAVLHIGENAVGVDGDDHDRPPHSPPSAPSSAPAFVAVGAPDSFTAVLPMSDALPPSDISDTDIHALMPLDTAASTPPHEHTHESHDTSDDTPLPTHAHNDRDTHDSDHDHDHAYKTEAEVEEVAAPIHDGARPLLLRDADPPALPLLPADLAPDYVMHAAGP